MGPINQGDVSLISPKKVSFRECNCPTELFILEKDSESYLGIT